jgi:hypothetical protein
MTNTVKINSISKLHEIMGYPEKPVHPLITLIDFSKIHLSKTDYNRRNV